MWGVSLGAWIVGLVACREPRTNFAVLLTPMVRMDQAIAELPFCEPIRRGLAGKQVPLGPLNLDSLAPLVAPEKILLVAARDDLLAPAATVEGLWRAWNQPEIWRCPHGHISILLALPILERMARWIAARAGSTVVQRASLPVV